MAGRSSYTIRNSILDLAIISPSPVYKIDEISDTQTVVYVPTSYLLYTNGVPLLAKFTDINYPWVHLPLNLNDEYIDLGKIDITHNKHTNTSKLTIKNPKLADITDIDNVTPLTGIVPHTAYCPSVFYGTPQTPIDTTIEAKTIVHEQKSDPGIHITPTSLTSFTIDIDNDLTGDHYIYLPYSLPWSNKPTNFGHASSVTDLPADAELYIFKIASLVKETTDVGQVFCPSVYSNLASLSGDTGHGWTYYPDISTPEKASDLLTRSYYPRIKPYVDYAVWAESIADMPDNKYLACVTGFICNIFIYGTALGYKNNKVFILNNSSDSPVTVESKQITVDSPYIQNAWELHTLSDMHTLSSILNSTSKIDVTNTWFPICYQLTKYWDYNNNRLFYYNTTPMTDNTAEHSWVDLSYYNPRAMAFTKGKIYPIFIPEEDYGSKIVPNTVSYPNSLVSSLVITDFFQQSYIDCAYYVNSEHCTLPLDFLDISISADPNTPLAYPPIFFPYNIDNANITQDTALVPVSTTPVNSIPTFHAFLTGRISRYVHPHYSSDGWVYFYYSTLKATNNNNTWGINTNKNPLVCYNNNATTAILLKLPTGISKGSYTFQLCDKYYQLDQPIANAYSKDQITEDTTSTKLDYAKELTIEGDINIMGTGAYTLKPSLSLYNIDYFTKSASKHINYCATFASAVPLYTPTTLTKAITSSTITVIIPILTSPAIAYPQHFAFFTLFPDGLPIDPTKIIELNEESDSLPSETISNSVMVSAPFNNTQDNQDISNYIGLISYQYSNCVYIANCNIDNGKLTNISAIAHTINLHTEYVTSVEELLGICHTYSFDSNHNKISVLCVNSIVTNYFGERIQGIFIINIFDYFNNILVTFYPINYYTNSVSPNAIPDDMLLPKGVATIGPYVYTLSYMHNYSFLDGSLGYSLCLNTFDIMTGSPMQSRPLTESSCAFFMQTIPPVSDNYILCYERELRNLPYPTYFSALSTGSTNAGNTTYPVYLKNTKPDPKQIPTVTGLASWGTELIAYHNGQKKLCKINPVTSLIERYAFTMLPFIGTWDGTMTEYNQSLLIPLWWGNITVVGQYPQMPLCVEDNQFTDAISNCIDIQNIALNIPTVRHLHLVNNTLRDRIENIELSIPDTVPDNMTLQLSLSEEGPWTDSITFDDIGIDPGAKHPFYLRVFATTHQEQAYISGLSSTFDRRTIFYA